MADNDPITALEVSTSPDQQANLTAQNYKFINADLNSGTGSKTQVYLWYKKECGQKPVTRIQFTFNSEMKSGLINAGFEQVSKDLNTGTTGDHIFLWYLCGATDADVPIVDLKVTMNASEEPELIKNGYERLGCDLNRNGRGNYVYLWVKRAEPTYIYEITATASHIRDKSFYEQGYICVDEDTNRSTTGSPVFLWYRRSKDKSKALSNLDVSVSLQEAFNLQEKGYKQVATNLNKGTCGNDIYVWSLKDGCNKIQGINLLVNPAAKSEYEMSGVTVIEKNLNEGNQGRVIYIAYFAA